MNQRRGNGTVVPFKVVPFVNGNDPTQPPVSCGFYPPLFNDGSEFAYDQDNLPPLYSVNEIENLNEHDLLEYLNGYGVVPLATNYLQKETLKRLVGTSLG
jgi:hypothetical protein